VIPDTGTNQFSCHRAFLYSPDELFRNFDMNSPDSYENTPDKLIYNEYKAFNSQVEVDDLSQEISGSKSQGEKFDTHMQRNQPDGAPIEVKLMRRLHDHSITDALMEALVDRKVVAIMGGHSMLRASDDYAMIARIARTLTRAGFLIVSGGGPGAMEASNLGAYFSAFDSIDLDTAIDILKVRPKEASNDKSRANNEYKDEDWLARAFAVLKKFPLKKGSESRSMSIGIPTWFYGHEPPSPFSTHIAKYFANSVREDGLLEIANHGIVFAPGSAGTTQEIFQDACQNHYGTFKYISPMILMGKKYWTETRPVWPLLQKVSEGQLYGELLALTDNEDEIVRRILSYNPTLYLSDKKARDEYINSQWSLWNVV
jgi:predicted Rossmann-fold nucleotide-binding protein